MSLTDEEINEPIEAAYKTFRTVVEELAKKGACPLTSGSDVVGVAEADTKAMGAATDRSLLSQVVRVAGTNNGRPQYGNRSGFDGVQNRRIEPSRV
jgi:hypothetical protein